MNLLRRRWPEAAIALLAIAASITSLGNGFAYDDGPIVVANERIHALSGIWRLFAESYWGPNVPAGGYRPLTLAGFTLQWAGGGSRPIAFHAVSVGLYIALSLAVLTLARRALPRPAAWLAAALFAVHPVHVEAVGNVVGQAELIVALACAVAVALYTRERSEGLMRPRAAFAILALFAAALLAKEHAVVLPLLLLAAELTVVQDRRPLRERFATARAFVLGLVVVGVGYIVVRSLVLGDVAGMPPHTAYVGLRLTGAHRVLTMIGFAKEWARLLLWPSRLVAEYSPPLTPFAIEPGVEQLPGAIIIAGTLMVLWVAVRRGWRDIAFGLSWVIIAMLPVSGFLFPTGFILAERTLMLPSVGAMIAVVAAGHRLLAAAPPEVRCARPVRIGLAAGMALLLAAGAARSAIRQPVWRNNDVLFSQTVIDAPTSYRAHQVFGSWLFERGYPGKGEEHMWRAIRLYPYDPIPPYLLAEQYRKKGACGRALPLYKWSLATTDTAASFALGPYGRCLLEVGRLEEAREQAMRGVGRGRDVRQFRELLARIDSARRRRDRAAAGGD